MVRTDLLPKLSPKSGLARPAWALAASCVFHAAVLGLLVALVIYRTKNLPPPSRSQAEEPSITLSTLVITPPPPSQPAPHSPAPARPVAATPPAPVIAETPLPQPAPVTAAVSLSAPVPAPPAVIPSPTAPARPATQPAAPRVAKASPVKPRPAAPGSFASSYAPGENVLPHPPYPEEAQDLGETGTVVMTVTFDTSGDVARAAVAQSSGVRLLDANTRSFILAHWHSATLAGQTVTQPVRYTGE